MNLELGRPDFDNVDRPYAAQARLSVRPDDSQTAWPENTPGFRANEFVAYPAHGVGQILAIDVQTVAGDSLEFFVIYFAKSKMRVRVSQAAKRNPLYKGPERQSGRSSPGASSRNAL